MNTKEKGIFRFILFKEKAEYVAVCLDLNIIEYGKNPKELGESIVEAAFSYLESVKSKNLSDEYLNQPAPDKYWKKMSKINGEAFENKEIKKSILTEIPKNSSCFFNTMINSYGINGSNC
jgi:hypothetical protein